MRLGNRAPARSKPPRRSMLLVVCLCGYWATWSGPPALYGQDEAVPRMLPPLDAPAAAEVTVDEILGDPPASDDSLAGWLQPTEWFLSPVWDVGLELGINGSEGNTQSLSLLASTHAKRQTEGNTLDLGLTYGKTQANGVETQNYAVFNSRWDWNMTPAWFLYNKNVLEYDEFKAFDLRLVFSGGLGYHLIKHDATTLTGRWGAGASHEIGGPDEDWVPEANLGLDFEHKLSARQKVKMTSDYYPAWEDFLDYRLLLNAHWEILLDEETNLSLKLGVIDRYDSTPNGRGYNDLDYFITLVWKL